MSPPRHVLMTADTGSGGWSHAAELCGALVHHGVKVTLMSMGRLPDDEQRAQIDKLGNVDLVPTAYRTKWTAGWEDDLERSGENLLRLEAALAPDVVHLNGYWHGGLCFRAPVLVAAQSSSALWWKACRQEEMPPQWSSYANLVSSAVERAHMLVAPTEAFLAEFQSMHGNASAARAIPNGISATRCKPGVKRRIVLAAGRVWDEAKNISLLCRVAETVDAPIVVAGELVAPDGTVAEAGGVAALGRLSSAELSRWMAEAAIFAAPARYEPSGLAILEAALSGCALILSDIPSLRELWDGAATFIQPDDVAGLRRAIRMLSEMPQLAASDGRKARERALTYSAERMGDAYYRTYQDMLAAAVGVAA